jgi:hypothetical protein
MKESWAWIFVELAEFFPGVLLFWLLKTSVRRVTGKTRVLAPGKIPRPDDWPIPYPQVGRFVATE